MILARTDTRAGVAFCLQERAQYLIFPSGVASFIQDVSKLCVGIGSVGEFVGLAFGHCTHETVDRLAVLKGDDGRYWLNAKLTGNRQVVFDVYLNQRDPYPGSLDNALDNWGYLLAWAAPRCAKIDQHRLVTRFLYHIGSEDCSLRFLR